LRLPPNSRLTYSINQSGVLPCGESGLWARTDDEASWVGVEKQYRLLEPQP